MFKQRNPRPLFGCRSRKRPAARPRNARPRLEALEDRLAPAVFNVNSPLDLSIAAGVNPDGTIIGQGKTVTLRSAIQAANANSGAGGNTINLTVPGTYAITQAGTTGQTDNLRGEFSIYPTAPNGNLTIVNTSGGAVTVDGNHLNRVFDINAGDTNNPPTQFLVTMQGFTIQDGDAFDPANPDGPTSTGGGIRDQGNQSLTLTNMVVTKNVASADGGGVVMENLVNVGTWTLTVNNSTISDNHSGDAGGGIDTDGTGMVVINPGTVITGNTDLNQGAGVYIDTIAVGATFPGASMNMTGTVVSNNQALANGVTASGGGISNAGNGTMTILSSTIANNFSGGSGGGFSDENSFGILVVSNCFFTNNSAIGDGGGIQEGGPSTTIANSFFHGNSSGGSGGGLFANGITLIVSGSTFVNNTATAGGGGAEVRTSGFGAGSSFLINCTLTGNSALNNAGANGGGLDAPAAFVGTLNLVNDTLNGNFASGGGGIFYGTAGGIIGLLNTIVANNVAATGPDADNLGAGFTFNDFGGNLIGVSGPGSGNIGFTAATTQTGTVAAPLNPLLGPLQNNGGPTVGLPGANITLQTEALLPGSPALDKGVPAGAPTTDERGFPRPDVGPGEHPDVGAFEFQDVTLTVSIQAATPSVLVGSGDTITVTLTNTGGNALPAENTTLAVTLPAGLTPAAGTPLTFVVGPLQPTQTATFTVPVTATTVGTQTVTATVTSPDASPNSVQNSAFVLVTAPPPPPPAPPPFVSVAFGPFGEVVELVDSMGNLTQFDALGAHVLGGGVRAASVAFNAGSEVLLLTFVNGALAQFDAAGAHLLGSSGVLSASVAFGPFGEVIEVVDVNGNLTQFDAFGAHFIGGGARSASVAFGPTGEVLVVAFAGGGLAQYDAAGAHALGGGVASAAVAFDASGAEVLDVLFQSKLLYQFDSTGAHLLGPVP
jgi:hypothetical protein